MSVKPSTCRLAHLLVKPETDATAPLANWEVPVNGISTGLEEALAGTVF
jgi:hypothetical protein